MPPPEQAQQSADEIIDFKGVYNPEHKSIKIIEQKDVFFLWAPLILLEKNKNLSQAEFNKEYKRVEQAYNDVADILNSFFYNGRDFLNTKWHYELVKICYQGEDPRALLSKMRSHRYNNFKDWQKAGKSYQEKLNEENSIDIKKLKRNSEHASKENLKKMLNKKWNEDECNLNPSSLEYLNSQDLLDITYTYQDLKKLTHILENKYYKDEVNVDDLLLEYFSPRENIIDLWKVQNGAEKVPSCPQGFVVFVKTYKDKLTYKQYQGLLEYALLYPDKMQTMGDNIDPIALADAYLYAYECWKDDLNSLLNNATLKDEKKLQKYRLSCLLTDDFFPYMTIHYNGQYLQRFINWIADQLRWCYNHPCKATILLILSLAFSKLLVIYQPALKLVGLFSSHVTWHTPVWLEMMGSLTTARGVTGLIARAILGQQHPMLFAFNKLIANNAQKTIDHINIDFSQIPDQLANFATIFKN